MGEDLGEITYTCTSHMHVTIQAKIKLKMLTNKKKKRTLQLGCAVSGDSHIQVKLSLPLKEQSFCFTTL